MVVSYRTVYFQVFRFDKETNKSPSFQKLANTTIAACVPTDESCNDRTDKAASDSRRLVQLLPIVAWFVLERGLLENLIVHFDPS